MTEFHGVIPPVVIARHEDGTFDEESTTKNLNRLLEAGVDGLFILGSSGEGAFVTDTERDQVVKNAIAVAGGKVPVLVGCIDTQTSRVIEHIKHAEAVGADGIVATAPFYALGGLPQVERHFRLLHEATSLPIFAYDIPVCVHVKLPPELLIKLGKDGVLAGVKDSSGDDVSFRFLAQLNNEAGHPLRLFTGHEVVVDGAYLSGADGSVPGLGNVDPWGYVRQWQAYQKGDWETVRAEQDRLARLMRITGVATSITGFGGGVGAFKQALKLQGIFASATMPEPVAELTEEEIAQIREILEAEGAL
ncbi:dihydrodipicolinate synthase family protein [Corynebacterium pyruviciproducens]|uniref:Dihydrodipicolinate synthase family protein n=1 Tax=Corynebacterium pyruviciproducens TaxID=598660 RepID=A0AAF1BZI6_9CORY|nr:dihydrodipicolinate synthase family protein [Corynebacterium pyruviciproducens]MDK6567051.1 dihydrodipicolinate synthase family protein [Corynebacterium pyruviciproducens]WOT02720.1 dihydrodipicolinate synthase family protein [Corynebacterium pyruviciproducens]